MNVLELEIILKSWSDTMCCWLYLECSQVVFCWREVIIIYIKLEPNYNTKTVIVQLAWFWRVNSNISHPFNAMKSSD